MAECLFSSFFFNTYCFALLIVGLLSQECTSTLHIPHVQGLIPQAQLLCILFKTSPVVYTQWLAILQCRCNVCRAFYKLDFHGVQKT